MSGALITDTHQLYNTVDHEHLDCLVYWARKPADFPEDGLLLVECADGRWFVEVEFGNRFDQINGICKPALTPFAEPAFFASQDLALQFAYACLKQAYPELEGRDLSEYFKDED